MNNSAAKMKFVSSVVIFGTIGLFVRYIPLPSSLIAMVRGLVGALFIFALLKLKGIALQRGQIRKNLLLLVLAGAALGFNWILLFEAYRYTTIATATLCYYLAPAFVIIVSPIVLNEKLTVKKVICVAASLAGMVLVSGMLDAGFSGGSEYIGVLFGVGAACLYATIIILNKKIENLSSYDTTFVELAVAGIVLLPYVALTGDLSFSGAGTIGIILLAVVAVIHTGVCYALYFGGIKEIPAQSVAVLSYIDPIVAILCSAVFLKEAMSTGDIVGAVLILGAALVSELF